MRSSRGQVHRVEGNGNRQIIRTYFCKRWQPARIKVSFDSTKMFSDLKVPETIASDRLANVSDGVLNYAITNWSSAKEAPGH